MMRPALRFALFSLLLLIAANLSAAEPPRPNVVWITIEDLNPIIGPYGDTIARTPHLDEFAKNSLLYKTCWSNAPVCAPARTTLITGMYATSLGAEHMRSEVRLPADWKLYPQVLRDAGYYCTNNQKTDYNIVPNGEVWDDSSKTAHWKNRPEGKPFFAIFNTTVTHESGVHNRRKLVTDPATVRVPAYQPDLPEIRADIAQYYDNVALMDDYVGKHLKELADAGLADDTIVWFYSDHGSGLPRCKRVPFNSGLQVPFILHIPEKFKDLRPADYLPGGETSRLVSFVDFGPTLLSLCGVQPPAYMQGQPFLGKFTTEPRKYLFGYRGRMDERIDVVRSVTDGRYVYVRNFMPEKPQGGYLAYMYKQAGVQAWRAAFETGNLPPEQAAFFLPKPAEALFDLESDPDEIRNLADDASARSHLTELRGALHTHILESHDLGLLPEAEMHRLSAGQPPVTLAGSERYPARAILESTAPTAGKTAAPDLASPVAAMRYWAVRRVAEDQQAGVGAHRDELSRLLVDESPSVRIAAAEALGRFGGDSERTTAMSVLAELCDPKKQGVPTAVLALNSIDTLSPLPANVVATLKANSEVPPGTPQRMREYVPRLIERITASAASNE